MSTYQLYHSRLKNLRPEVFLESGGVSLRYLLLAELSSESHLFDLSGWRSCCPHMCGKAKVEPVTHSVKGQLVYIWGLYVYGGRLNFLKNNHLDMKLL